ncbi:MAG: hypothetical protein K2P86_02790 [Xanthobacteraceae bacterium]|nr:hypothetical protein [Xanthobacteraceae bacterium]
MAKPTNPGLARLAFWSQNMLVVRESNMSWFGFSYSLEEWKRMEALADKVGGGPYLKFLLLNALLFVILTGIAIVGFFLPVLLLIYPDTRDLQPLPFVLLLSSTTLIAIGVGLPLTMRVAAWLCASEELRAARITAAQDLALERKVSWQLLRMTLIMCGALVPGMLLWIALDIDGGPILTVLKIVCALLVAGSVATAALRKMPS